MKKIHVGQLDYVGASLAVDLRVATNSSGTGAPRPSVEQNSSVGSVLTCPGGELGTKMVPVCSPVNRA